MAGGAGFLAFIFSPESCKRPLSKDTSLGLEYWRTFLDQQRFAIVDICDAENS